MHVAIILDGNRRYAKSKKMPAWQGHRKGAKKVKELISWCDSLGITELTLYSFSIENFNRPKTEKDELFKLFRNNIKSISDEKKNKARINFIGRLFLFPDDIQRSMKELMDSTEKNQGLRVNFAMAYGGRAEIVDCCKKIAIAAKKHSIEIDDIDEEMLNDNMYLQSQPDLIIRPGGEKRISNFLLWQGYYSEWYFTDRLWPEFTKEELIKAISEYNKRERRFGK